MTFLLASLIFLFKSESETIFVLIAFFILLFVSNLYYFFSDYSISTLFPLVIQLIIILLLIYKNYRVKMVIRIWSGLFLIIANCLIFFGKLLKDFSYDFQNFNYRNYLGSLIMLIIGIVVFWLNEKMVIVSENEIINGNL